MILPKLKAEIVTRRQKGQDCSALIVLCRSMEMVLCKHSRLKRILDDPDAIDRLMEDDEAIERMLKDI